MPALPRSRSAASACFRRAARRECCGWASSTGARARSSICSGRSSDAAGAAGVGPDERAVSSAPDAGALAGEPSVRSAAAPARGTERRRAVDGRPRHAVPKPAVLVRAGLYSRWRRRYLRVSMTVVALVARWRISSARCRSRCFWRAGWGAADLRRVGSGNLGAANVLRASGVTRRRAGGAARHRRRARPACCWPQRLDRRRAVAGGGRARRDRRPHLSGLAALPRRQGRRDGVRRLLRADAAGGRRRRSPFSSHGVWLTRYVSLGSMLASLALPPIAYATGSPAPVRGRRARRVRAHRRSGTARTWRGCGRDRAADRLR